MNLLIVDSSSGNLSFCITEGEKLVLDFNHHLKFGASTLIVEVYKVFKKLSLRPEDFDAFVIGSGPGSFTGLRISFSIIKAFSIATGKPIISISSFFSCAYPFKDKFKEIAVISDARKNLIYYGSFKSKKGILLRSGKLKLMSLKELTRIKKDIFITYDFHLRKELLNYNSEIKIYKEDIYPKARYLVEEAKGLYTKGKFTSVDKLDPLYLHPKTCQIRRK